jgi:hypothetical protein
VLGSVLGLRRREPALQPGSRTDVIELDDHGLTVVRDHAQGEAIVLVSWLKESGGEYDSRRHGPVGSAARWSLVLSTEEPRFEESPSEERAMFAPDIDLEDSPVMRFHRPSAVILRRR